MHFLLLFVISPWLLIPPIVVLITAVKKVPAIPSLLLATTVGSILAMIFQKANLVDVLNVLQNGYVGETNVEIVNKTLLGVESMECYGQFLL